MAKDNEVFKQPYMVEQFTADQVKELHKCKKDFVYFATTYVKITFVESTPDGESMKTSVFNPYPFQNEMMDVLVNNKHSIFRIGRQMGKTTVAAIYILWRSVFFAKEKILITSYTKDASIEVLTRIKDMFDLLPQWMKPGQVLWNVTNIELDNKSRVVTRATTGETGRGFTPTLIYCDEFARIEPVKQKLFWTAIRPSIATGGKCIITSTPRSNEDTFATLWQSAIDTFDEFGNEKEDKTGSNGFRAIKYTWRDHPHRDDKWAAEERASIGETLFRQEYEVEFILDSDTLIDNIMLSNMKGIDPILNSHNIRWYKKPEPNKIYLVSLDPSVGVEKDNAAIQVFQLPECVQVAEWKHNKTPIHGKHGQVRILLDLLKFLREYMIDSGEQYDEPEIYWTVENNGIGEAVNSVIHETGEDKFPGTYLKEPKKKNTPRPKTKGFKTTHTTKVESCIRLKSLVERNEITLYSKALISELKNFVRVGNSYRAKTGEKDDLVSALLLIVRMIDIVKKYNSELEYKFSESVDDDEDGRPPLPFMFT